MILLLTRNNTIPSCRHSHISTAVRPLDTLGHRPVTCICLGAAVLLGIADMSAHIPTFAPSLALFTTRPSHL